MGNMVSRISWFVLIQPRIPRFIAPAQDAKAQRVVAGGSVCKPPTSLLWHKGDSNEDNGLGHESSSFDNLVMASAE